MIRKPLPAMSIACSLAVIAAVFVGLAGCGSESPGPQDADQAQPGEDQPDQPAAPAGAALPEVPEVPTIPGSDLSGQPPYEPGPMLPGSEAPDFSQPPLGEPPPGIGPPGFEPGPAEPPTGEPYSPEPFSPEPPRTELPGTELPGTAPPRTELPGAELPDTVPPRTELPATGLPPLGELPTGRPPSGLPSFETPSTPAEVRGRLNVTSDVLQQGKPIPKKYTGDGEDVSPPLSWSGVPAGTKQLALICDDPDAPRDEPWVHWVIYAIPPEAAGLPEGVPRSERLENPPGALQGRNSWPSDSIGYRGPAPPPAHDAHRYFFKLYALDTALKLEPGLSKDELLSAIKDHVLAEGQLLGTYDR
jgi:Raf kinase inhibitor-like YbhB/YbcL family protein